MSEQVRNLESIFSEALEIRSPGGRRAYLDEMCGQATSLRSEVEELLAANEEMTRFLDVKRQPTVKFQIGNLIGTHVGPYRILAQIGEGGMGVVYVAQQDKPIKRRVALKIIKPGMDTKEVLARFEQERQSLAMMEHPNIAKVLDAGATEAGYSYFVMELVQGKSITEYCDENKFPNEKRLELFIDLCGALQHAHQKGIIHRDIKPANVLVATIDDKPVVKVIDFGVAKATSQSLTELTLRTQVNQVIGTPTYMSPEQAELTTMDIDTRSDIYSMGVLLYELLTGSTPFTRERLRKVAFDEMRRIIREETPPKPSSRISTLGDSATQASLNRQTSIQKLGNSLNEDIDWIVMKSLDKDRARRYDSASAMAADLERFLRCEPVLAGPPSLTYRLRKFTRRNQKSLLASAALATMVLVTMAIIVRMQNAAFAQGKVESLMSAEISNVPAILSEIEKYRYWADPLLKKKFGATTSTSEEKLRLALALLPVDDSKIEFLADRMLEGSAAEFLIARDALYDHRQRLIEKLWPVANDHAANPTPAFVAACALATYDPDSPSWNNEQLANFIAERLVSTWPSEFSQWQQSLEPVKSHLVPSLSAIFRDESRTDAERNFATDTLVRYVQGEPDKLFDLLADANEQQFPQLLKQLDGDRSIAIQLGLAELARSNDEDATNEEKENLACRQSNIAVMLVHLNSGNDVWPLLKFQPDPRLASWIIHKLSLLKASPQPLIQQLLVEPDPTILRGLIQALGEYGQHASIDQESLSNKLLQWYANHTDPGVRSSCEWTLRQWDQYQDQMQDIDRRLATGNIEGNRRWFVTKNNQHTMVLFEPTDEFKMGSPEDESGRIPSREMQAVVDIPYNIAVASKEITRTQWQAFLDANPDVKYKEVALSVNPQNPQGSINFLDAAKYCRWLSEAENIPEDQMCFPPIPEIKDGMKLPKDYLERTGYRIPINPEWEYACRAGTTTSRCYGDSLELLHKYGWNDWSNRPFKSIFGPQPVGRLKPNAAGIADMHGNVVEWSLEKYVHGIAQTGVPRKILNHIDEPRVKDLDGRILRGGHFQNRDSAVRSAYISWDTVDGRYPGHGFRVVRTVKNSEADDDDDAR